MKRVIHQLIDDINGKEATGTVEFSLDGVAYTIDLDDKNQGKLRDALAPFVGVAQRVGRTGGGVQARRPAVSVASSNGAGRQSREQLQAIRDWAKGQGFEVSDRGRIKAEIVDKFNEAHKPGVTSTAEAVDNVILMPKPKPEAVAKPAGKSSRATAK